MKLQTSGTFNTAADVDAIVDVDAFGADENAIEPEGVYIFSSSIVLNAHASRTQIDSLTVNTASTFDERPGLVDAFESWDGRCRARRGRFLHRGPFHARRSAGTPTWSP